MMHASCYLIYESSYYQNLHPDRDSANSAVPHSHDGVVDFAIATAGWIIIYSTTYIKR